MQFSDIADWVGPTPNENPGGMLDVVGLVLHIQDGTQAGSIAWCKNPASQVSAHFFAPKSGRLVQLVDTADRAWAEAGGNSTWISVENEGWSGQDLTPAQLESCAQLAAKLYVVSKIPLVETDNPGVGGIGWHGMGGAAWGAHPDCPGDPVKMQRPYIISRALQIIGQPATLPLPPTRTAPAWPGDLFFHPGPNGHDVVGPDVREWQARMAWRGWTIAVDGDYGPQSAAVCTAFQQDSNAHNWPLTVDGEVGENTWRAAWERPVSRP